MHTAELEARQSPDDAELLVKAGAANADVGEPLRALAWFKMARKLNPKHLQAAGGEGQMWMALGHPGYALDAYVVALNLERNSPDLHREIARALSELRDFPASIRILERLLEQDPNDTQAMAGLAFCRAEMGDVPGALKHAEAALRTAPRQVDGHLLRARLLQRSQRTDDAIAGYRDVLKLQPDHVDAKVSLAQVLLQSRRTTNPDDEAFKLLSSALEVNPDHVDALRMQGEILSRKGAYPLAVTALQRARESSPKDPAVLLALGQALMRSGRAQEGVRLTAQSRALGPKGMAFTDLEREAQGSDDYRLTLRLGQLYIDEGMSEAAVHLFRAAARKEGAPLAVRTALRRATKASEAGLPKLPNPLKE